MANLFWISAAKVLKDLGSGPYTAAELLSEYGWTFARADASTCATYFDRDGILRTAAANLLRPEWVDLDGDGVRETMGFRLEGARTNVALWNRDLTNAAWTKTNITPVKDQTGIDGVSNSASKITATAGNGTCLQAVVLASSLRRQSAFVKRITGSGVVEMTTDNGTTWTAVTVTAAWTRVTIPAQTLANPTLGFRIVTSGDAVAVDYAQNETGAFESTPIATTTAAVTRATDSWIFTAAFGPVDFTIWQRSARPDWMTLAGDIVSAPYFARVGTTAPLLNLRTGSSSRIYVGDVDTATTDAQATASIPAGTLSSTWQFKEFATGAKVAIDPGSGLGVFSAASSPVVAFSNQTFRVGGSGTAGQELFGVLLDLKARQGLETLTSMATEPSFAPFNPHEVTDFDTPGPLISKAGSGRVNVRNTQQIGRTWTERYLLSEATTSHREFLSRMRQYWANGTFFEKSHPDYITPKGAGGGVPRVKGASQTGSTLIVDGCPLNTANWLRAGDIFRVEGLPQVLECAADVHTEGDGRALIPLTRPIFTGGSPSDNAGLTITAVVLDVVLLEPPGWPTTSGRSVDYGELSLVFSETL